MIRFVVVLGVGYVLGSKAGRERYEQLKGTYQAIAQSPAAKSVIEAGRRKVAEMVSPDPGLTELTVIESDGTEQPGPR